MELPDLALCNHYRGHSLSHDFTLLFFLIFRNFEIMKIKTSHILFFFAIIMLVVFIADSSFAQCSMCRKIATDGASTKAAGNTLNKGILYLLALPYFLMGFFFRKQITGFVKRFLK